MIANSGMQARLRSVVTNSEVKTSSELITILFFILTGFSPILSIYMRVFLDVPLPDSLVYFIVPLLTISTILGVFNPRIGFTAFSALIIGAVSTVIYDFWRWSFLYLRLSSDFVPKIGRELAHGHAIWSDTSIGYLWRYAGNGGGMCIAYVMIVLMLLGSRKWNKFNGIIYGLFVCSCLIFTASLAPHASELLFRLTFASFVMAVGGHVIYGYCIGKLMQRFGEFYVRP